MLYTGLAQIWHQINTFSCSNDVETRIYVASSTHPCMFQYNIFDILRWEYVQARVENYCAETCICVYEYLGLHEGIFYYSDLFRVFSFVSIQTLCIETTELFLFLNLNHFLDRSQIISIKNGQKRCLIFDDINWVMTTKICIDQSAFNLLWLETEAETERA